MDFGQLFGTLEDYRHAGIADLDTLTTLLNRNFRDWLASHGLGAVAVLADNRVCLNVNGRLKAGSQPDGVAGVVCYARFLVVALDDVADASEAVSDALKAYISEGDGAYIWVVPDGYMAALTPAEQAWEAHGGGYFSHESICISNTADIDTVCVLEVLYEDTERANVSCEFDVPAHRSVHYRLDKLKDATGAPLIAKDAPVSYKITSRDARVVVQGSRILTSGEDSAFASFGTVMGWSPQ